MQRLFSILLTLLVFSGSIGVPLYRHTCLHERITIRTLFTASDHCETGHSKVLPEKVESCCAVPAEKQQIKEHCCTEEVTRLALPFSYVEHARLIHFVAPDALLPVRSYQYVIADISENNSVVYVAYADPPPLSVRERLPVNCCWRL